MARKEPEEVFESTTVRNDAGILLDGAGLMRSSHGARVRFSGADRTVIDGPFAETKEVIAGFSVWEVKSLQEAIDWVKKSPNLSNQDYEIEIRPYFLHDLEDFGDALTPEIKEQEARQDVRLQSKLKSTLSQVVVRSRRGPLD